MKLSSQPWFWLLLVFAASVHAAAAPEVSIVSHRLELSLDPATHALRGKDAVEIKAEAKGVNEISLLLNQSLKVKSIAAKQQPLQYTTAKSDLDEALQTVRIKLSAPLPVNGTIKLSISYQGSIFDPVAKSQALAFITGDATRGLISSEGVYLAKDTFFIVDQEISLATYDITIELPEAYLAVTQGNLISTETKLGKRRQHFSSPVPADGLTLVANTFVTKSTTRGGVAVSTYLFPDDANFADMILEATASYLDLYTGLLGAFPYNRFDVVENFFTTGFGMPAFTLLGSDVIKQGRFILRPGHIDHELVHSWWGNYVFPPQNGENWAEGITTYLSNYYRQEKEDEKLGADFRRRVLQKYADMVTADNEYPVREFKGKQVEEDNEIGYDKAAMIFHMLRRKLGDDVFFKGLRRVLQMRGGKFAGWNDFRVAFEMESGVKLETFFTQWLDRKGGPHLKLEPLTATLERGEIQVSGAILQDEPYYDLDLPICYRFQGGDMFQTVKVSGAKTPLRYRFDTMPYELTLDPNAEVFRSLTPDEVLPCLNRTLHSPPVTIVKPSHPGSESAPYYDIIVDRASKNEIKVVLDSELTPADVAQQSVWILGNPEENELLKALQDKLDPTKVAFTAGGFKVNGKTYSNPETALLISIANPLNKQLALTIYAGYSKAALERSRLVFFYGWDGFIVFQKGAPLERGGFAAQSPLTVQNLNAFTPPTKLLPAMQAAVDSINAKSIAATVKQLSKKKYKGRLAGSVGEHKAAKYLQMQMAGLGLEPLFPDFQQPVEVVVQDIADRTLTFTSGDRAVTAERDEFFILPGFNQPRWQHLDLVFVPHNYPASQMPALAKKLTGRVMVVTAPTTTAGDAFDDWQQLIELGTKSLVSGMIVITPEEKPDCPWCAYPSGQTEAVKQAMARSAKRLPSPSLELQIAGIQQRAPRPQNDSKLTVVIAAQPLATKVLAPLGLQLETLDRSEETVMLEATTVELNISEKRVSKNAVNLVGAIHGGKADAAAPWILLSAHYDHLGQDQKGHYYPGADDNASGVAGVLAIAKALEAQRADLKRNIAVALFTGEEWGLQGSSALASDLPDSINKLLAVINLDTIGRNDPDSIQFIGALRSNDLRALFAKYAGIAGLSLKADIDFAFPFGSDHYPFYLRGIPAIDLCSSLHEDYHRITDTAEKVNAEKIARVARLTSMALMELAETGMALDVPRHINVPYPEKKPEPTGR